MRAKIIKLTDNDTTHQHYRVSEDEAGVLEQLSDSYYDRNRDYQEAKDCSVHEGSLEKKSLLSRLFHSYECKVPEDEDSEQNQQVLRCCSH